MIGRKGFSIFQLIFCISFSAHGAGQVTVKGGNGKVVSGIFAKKVSSGKVLSYKLFRGQLCMAGKGSTVICKRGKSMLSEGLMRFTCPSDASKYIEYVSAKSSGVFKHKSRFEDAQFAQCAIKNNVAQAKVVFLKTKYGKAENVFIISPKLNERALAKRPMTNHTVLKLSPKDMQDNEKKFRASYQREIDAYEKAKGAARGAGTAKKPVLGKMSNGKKGAMKRKKMWGTPPKKKGSGVEKEKK